MSEPLTLEDLMAFGSHAVLERDLVFEVILNDKEPKQQEVKRRVVFRRLTYEEIDILRKIPEDEPLRYATAVIKMGSMNPKFETVEQIVKTPHGFVRHYSKLILDESGKNPFLGKG